MKNRMQVQPALGRAEILVASSVTVGPMACANGYCGSKVRRPVPEPEQGLKALCVELGPHSGGESYFSWARSGRWFRLVMEGWGH